MSRQLLNKFFKKRTYKVNNTVQLHSYSYVFVFYSLAFLFSVVWSSSTVVRCSSFVLYFFLTTSTMITTHTTAISKITSTGTNSAGTMTEMGTLSTAALVKGSLSSNTSFILVPTMTFEKQQLCWVLGDCVGY